MTGIRRAVAAVLACGCTVACGTNDTGVFGSTQAGSAGGNASNSDSTGSSVGSVGPGSGGGNTSSTAGVGGAGGGTCGVALDPFDSGLDGWTYFGRPGYTLTNDAGAAYISGDSFSVPYNHAAGMQKKVSVTGAFVLSFKWRATSEFAGSTVTNTNLEIQNSSGMVLYSESLAAGGTLDTGWQNYSKDLSVDVAGQSSVTVVFYLNDGWAANHNQKNWYDDFKTCP